MQAFYMSSGNLYFGIIFSFEDAIQTTHFSGSFQQHSNIEFIRILRRNSNLLTCFNKLVTCFDIKSLYFFHDWGSYHIETSLLICSANHWIGFYIMGISAMKELKN